MPSPCQATNILQQYSFEAPTYLPDFYIYLRCQFVTPKYFSPLTPIPILPIPHVSFSCLSQVNSSPSPGSPRHSFIPSRVYSTAVQVRVQPHTGECSKTPTFVLFSISWMVSCMGILKLCRMLPPNTSVSSGV